MSSLTLELVPGAPAESHRTRRGARHPALLFLPLALSLAAVKLGAQEASPPPVRSARDVHIGIETDRSTYRLRDTVRVRISFKNVSSTPIAWSPGHHENDARVIVATIDGQVVAPTLSFGGAGYSSATRVRLQPQESWTWPWFPLSDWGYDIREPGTYTIVGIPRVMGYGIKPDLKTVRSNLATFTISP